MDEGGTKLLRGCAIAAAILFTNSLAAQDDSFVWENPYFDEATALLESVAGDPELLADRTDVVALRARGIGYARSGDLASSRRCFEIASDLGDPFSMKRVADALLNEDPPRASEGIALLRRAADAGYAPAAHNLAAQYWNGVAVQRNIPGSRRYYGLAAAQGIPPAMGNYGLMLVRGIGGPPEPERGIEYLARAADAGNIRARFNLGVQYLRGNGVPKDERQALHHFKIAADAGHEPAREASAKIEAEQRP